jgi:hypothetical protein
MIVALARFLLPAQAAVAAVGIMAAAMWPPSSGRLLLVPLLDGDRNMVAGIALAGGAMLLGPGPFPGSLVVIGDRSRLARRITGWTIVMTAAPPAGCGLGDDPAGAA